MIVCMCVLSHLVMFDSLQPRGLKPARLFCTWNFLGKNTGEGFHFLLQGIFLTQGLNWSLLFLLSWQQFLYHFTTWSVIACPEKLLKPLIFNLIFKTYNFKCFIFKHLMLIIFNNFEGMRTFPQ